MSSSQGPTKQGSSPSRLAAVLWQLMDLVLHKTSSVSPSKSSSLHPEKGCRAWGGPFAFLALDPSHQRPCWEDRLEIAPSIILSGASGRGSGAALWF